MTLAEYAHVLRRRWIAIVLLTAIGGLAGYAYAQFTPKQYRSSGSVLIMSTRGDSTAELTQGSIFVRDTIPSYVVLATSDLVLQPVIDNLNMDSSPRQLASLVSASAPLDSAAIEISVIHGDPNRAQEITAAVMESFSDAVAEVSPRTADDQPTVASRTIESATLPKWAFSPNTRLMTAGGALAGLVIGVLYALSRRIIGDHISDPLDLVELTSTPVLGQILETKRNTTLSRVILQDPLSPEAESVRALAANLNFLRVDGGLKSVVVTSSDEGEGKSTTALATALVVAESGKRVLLIDADLRRPSISTSTQMDGEVGLTDVLLGDIDLDEAALQWGNSNLTILMAGPVPPNPSQLLSSNSMEELIRATEEEFDLVIIDSGPILSVSDTMWLSHAGSGALLVARWGKTSRRRMSRAITALERVEATLLGIALVRKPRRGAARYEYTTSSTGVKGRVRSRQERRAPTPHFKSGKSASAPGSNGSTE